MTRVPSRRDGRPAFTRLLTEMLVEMAWSRDGCALVLLRLPQTASSAQTRDVSPDNPVESVSLIPLGERVREHIRASDDVILHPGYGIALLLGGATREGASVVFRRLREVIAPESAAGCAAETRQTTLKSGIEALAATDARDTDIVRGVLQRAAKSRLTLTVSLPIIATSQASLTSSVPLRIPAPAPLLIGQVFSQTDGASVGERARRAAGDGSSAASEPTLSVVHATPRRRKARQEAEKRDEPVVVPGIPYLALPQRLSASFRRALPVDLARALRAVVVGRASGSLTIALDAPATPETLERLREVTQQSIFPVLTSPAELDRALSQL